MFELWRPLHNCLNNQHATLPNASTHDLDFGDSLFFGSEI